MVFIFLAYLSQEFCSHFLPFNLWHCLPSSAVPWALGALAMLLSTQPRWSPDLPPHSHGSLQGVEEYALGQLPRV